MIMENEDIVTAAALQRAYDQGIKAGMTFGTFPQLVRENKSLYMKMKAMRRSVDSACRRYRRITRRWSLVSLIIGIALGLILARLIY